MEGLQEALADLLEVPHRLSACPQRKAGAVSASGCWGLASVDKRSHPLKQGCTVRPTRLHLRLVQAGMERVGLIQLVPIAVAALLRVIMFTSTAYGSILGLSAAFSDGPRSLAVVCT